MYGSDKVETKETVTCDAANLDLALSSLETLERTTYEEKLRMAGWLRWATVIDSIRSILSYRMYQGGF